MSIHYFDFCQSAAFVTHDADSSAISGFPAYPTTTDGYVNGNLVDPTGNADRDNTNPTHLASI